VPVLGTDVENIEWSAGSKRVRRVRYPSIGMTLAVVSRRRLERPDQHLKVGTRDHEAARNGMVQNLRGKNVSTKDRILKGEPRRISSAIKPGWKKLECPAGRITNVKCLRIKGHESGGGEGVARARRCSPPTAGDRGVGTSTRARSEYVMKRLPALSRPTRSGPRG